MKKFESIFNLALLESKFRTISKSLIANVKQTVLIYNSVYRKITKSDLKLLTDLVKGSEVWEDYFEDEPEVERIVVINKFLFTDLTNNKRHQVEVLVAYGNCEGSYAYYDEDNHFIVLYHNSIKELTDLELESVMIHELTHGFQQDKTQSEEYKKELKKLQKGKPYNQHVYFSEPIEFDAHMTELGHRITQEYKKYKQDIKNSLFPETKKILSKKLEKFLLELKLFIKSDVLAYTDYEELPLPEFFKLHSDFLHVIKSYLPLRQRLKKSLSKLYLDLTDEHP